MSFRLVRDLSSRSHSAGEFPNHSQPVTETMPHGSLRPRPRRPIPNPLTSPTLPEDEGRIVVTAFPSTSLRTVSLSNRMAVRCLGQGHLVLHFVLPFGPAFRPALWSRDLRLEGRLNVEGLSLPLDSSLRQAEKGDTGGELIERRYGRARCSAYGGWGVTLT